MEWVPDWVQGQVQGWVQGQVQDWVWDQVQVWVWVQGWVQVWVEFTSFERQSLHVNLSTTLLTMTTTRTMPTAIS